MKLWARRTPTGFVLPNGYVPSTPHTIIEHYHKFFNFKSKSDRKMCKDALPYLGYTTGMYAGLAFIEPDPVGPKKGLRYWSHTSFLNSRGASVSLPPDIVKLEDCDVAEPGDIILHASIGFHNPIDWQQIISHPNCLRTLYFSLGYRTLSTQHDLLIGRCIQDVKRLAMPVAAVIRPKNKRSPARRKNPNLSQRIITPLPLP